MKNLNINQEKINEKLRSVRFPLIEAFKLENETELNAKERLIKEILVDFQGREVDLDREVWINTYAYNLLVDYMRMNSTLKKYAFEIIKAYTYMTGKSAIFDEHAGIYVDLEKMALKAIEQFILTVLK